MTTEELVEFRRKEEEERKQKDEDLRYQEV